MDWHRAALTLTCCPRVTQRPLQRPRHPREELLAHPNWNAATEPAPLNMLADIGSSPAPAPPLPTLTGHIENDATAVLDALAEGARPGQPLIIPCARLIRIDFSAAGPVLNWAADQQAKGLDVRFQDLHRCGSALQRHWYQRTRLGRTA